MNHGQTRANLRDLAYNQMKQQYVEARSRGGAQRTSAADADISRARPRIAVEQYEGLKAIDVTHRIDALSDDDVRDVRSYEEQHRHRATVLRAIDRRLGEGR